MVDCGAGFNVYRIQNSQRESVTSMALINDFVSIGHVLLAPSG
jgi:hypothetical protein